MNLTGKHIAILGAGRSGRAAAALALREGARVSVWDVAGAEAFADMPEGVEIHPEAMRGAGLWMSSAICWWSARASIPTGPSSPRSAPHAGEVIGEVELAARFYQGKIVGITGTNGKTTTTELVGRILAHAGLGGTPCGNYGMPLPKW